MNYELRIMNYDIYSTFRFLILTSFFLILLIHLYGVRKFLWFVFREEGPVFALKSLVIGIVLYWVILSGALLSIIEAKIARVQGSAAS